MRSFLIDDSFRPWAAAGITAFLADDDVSLALQNQPSAKGRVPLAPVAGHAAVGANAGQPPFSRPAGRSPETERQYPSPRPHGVNVVSGASGIGEASEVGGTNFSRQDTPSFQTPHTQKEHTPESSFRSESRARLEEEMAGTIAIPPVFATRLANLVPAPVLWTYAHLGADLTGQGSPERSAFLRSVIQNLRLPKGTSVFWPYAFPENTEGAGTPEQGYAAFRQGVVKISPKMLIFIGKEALAPTEGQIDLHLPFTQKLYQGRLYLLLPDFAALLETPSLFEQTNSFLRAMLSAHGVIPGGR